MIPETVIWDKDQAKSVKGVHLRIREKSRGYYLSYRTRSGQQRRPKLGDESIGLTEARDRARSILSRVATGRDPKGEWDELRAEFSVDELFEQCFKNHWNNEPFLASGWARQVNYSYQNHIKPVFGKMKLSEVRPLLISDWMGGMRDVPTAGNRALEVFSTMYKYALKREHFTKTNPCTLVDSYTERKRSRFASPYEIKRIGEILRREAAEFPSQVAFIYLLMFSGARPRSIERATWGQLKEFTLGETKVGSITFDGKTTSKTGVEEMLILPPFAMSVLETLPKNSPTITGIKMPITFWNKIKKEVGCPDLRARDWRRTFATIGLSNGVNVGQIGELLNHKTAQTTKNYAKLSTDARVEASVHIANSLTEMLK